MKRIDNAWQFTPIWSEEFSHGENEYEEIRIPHTVKECPLHYIDVASYQMIYGYRRHLNIQDLSKRYFLQFDGAAHIATVYVNGMQLMHHECGYTAFRVEITSALHKGDNLVSVKLNTTEDASIPPFGFMIDYLTYGGIYRHVWLDEKESTYIKDVFVQPRSDLTSITSTITYDGDTSDMHVKAQIFDQEHICVVQKEYDSCLDTMTQFIPSPILWNVHHAYLYTFHLELYKGNTCIDVSDTPFGLRTITWDENNILINHKPVFIRGLNRHQSFPYVGYAVSDSLQKEDARILDEELGVNAVRTSHYPQSHAFINECDRRSILVFTEIPGWQYVSSSQHWRDICINNVEEMVKQYRNHPSIFMWGVRVNESQDDDELYTRTNALAHSLDPTRPTSGVLYIEKSSFLEDIYSYNDFSHNGTNPGCKKKKDVTPDTKKPLLISECNGHMFPTKSFDPISKRQEHALRHARVMNDAIQDKQHAGMFSWCMFDYATHKDFGSGDKICYHGVMDNFRNPKLASYVYSSQQENTPVLEVGTTMDIGDYPAGQIASFYCFTNGDSIRLYKNDVFVKEFSTTPFTSLKHGPILIDDTIGDLLETQEHMPKQQAKDIRSCLLAARDYGLANLPLKNKLQFAKAMMKYHLTFQDGVDLYGKYVSNWGDEATRWRFDAIKNGTVIASKTKCPGSFLHIEAKISSTVLEESDTYDMASIRIRILDDHDSVASYAQLPLTIHASNNLEIIGGERIVSEGGMCGTFIRSKAVSSHEMITISSPGLEPVTLHIQIRG